MYQFFLELLPVERKLALRPEEVNVVLELELEHEVLGDVVLGVRGVHGVAQQGQACQREVVLTKKIYFICSELAKKY